MNAYEFLENKTKQNNKYSIFNFKIITNFILCKFVKRPCD